MVRTEFALYFSRSVSFFCWEPHSSNSTKTSRLYFKNSLPLYIIDYITMTKRVSRCVLYERTGGCPQLSYLNVNWGGQPSLNCSNTHKISRSLERFPIGFRKSICRACKLTYFLIDIMNPYKLNTRFHDAFTLIICI